MDLSISTATPRTGISKTDSHRCKVGEGFDFSQNCVLHVFFVFVKADCLAVTSQRTQLHQLLRIKLSSLEGSIAVAIPRGFTGYIYINNDADNLTADCPIADTAARISPRQPVHFSQEIQEVVKTESEQRRNAKGRYFLGMAADQSEFMLCADRSLPETSCSS